MEILITIILILVFFQFLPIILIIGGIVHILSGNIVLGIVMLALGWMFSN